MCVSVCVSLCTPPAINKCIGLHHTHTNVLKDTHMRAHTCAHSPVALLCATPSCYHGDDELAVHHHNGVVAQLKVKGCGWHGVFVYKVSV